MDGRHTWSRAEIERLMRLRPQHSLDELAREFGTTKNAVGAVAGTPRRWFVGAIPNDPAKAEISVCIEPARAPAARAPGRLLPLAARQSGRGGIPFLR